MNHQLLSGLTATLLITNLSGAPSSYAESAELAELTQKSANLIATDSTTTPESIVRDSATTSAPVDQPRMNGQSSIAEILAHEVSGRRAATLYVRDIPVLTFLDSTLSSADQRSNSASTLPVDVSATQPDSVAQQPSGSFQFSQLQSDPVWRAMTLATQLNYLHQQQLDATKITVKWESDPNVREVSMLPAMKADQQLPSYPSTLVAGTPTLDAAKLPTSTSVPTGAVSTLVVPPTRSNNPQRGRYVIQVDGKNLLVMDTTTILSGTTQNPAEDALQATNRLRRLMGNAPPLKEIMGMPKVEQTAVAYRTPRYQFTGMASWYGPGFHGNYSANGEVFNQFALTAAHPHLPFGTMVRVTNLDNGRSVVVRINDRGPYAGGRIIDLSMGAAEAIGMLSSGVAQVRLEVLN
ncbi:MAG: septal ring lytic transglycosylase RlpA family protein [Cyanobacteria bacterium]|nr:septal ring lytic transglycosylase RlpA family protein [Cyanobacteriota bacterium]MDW8202388.1 septal ring lytic transglycosylase RlpA family protein [Cyanobacteriota bacterium SKYGB_h_bin112]